MKSLRGKGILMFFGMIAMMAVSMCVLFLPPVAIAESDSLLAAQSENGGNGEWIVKWVSDPEPAILDHAQLIATDPQTRTWVIRPDSTIDIPGWLAKWRQSQGVAYIQPNYIVKTYATTSNDPLLKKQDYLNQIKAYQAWDKVTGNENIIIAIVDTGVDLNHPDLKDNLVDGINLLATNAPPEDDNGHGTQLAGILAARGGNQIGISGVLWKAKVMPIKVLDKNGEGDDFIVAKGIRYAADKGAKIILMSSGIPTYSANMEEAVAYAQKRGVLVVAATGNEGDRVNYPAAFPGVIAVGGVNSKDQWSSFSNYGAEVDMVAPAEKIYTTNNQGFYDYATGTSMAAPQVAGAAALIWALHPNDTADQVRQRLRQSADDLGTPGWNNKTGYGRLNLYRAVSENLSSDIYEPNDRMGKAAIIPINKTINAKLSSADDVDWFKVNVPYNGLLTWDVQLVKQLDYGIRMELYMPNNPTPILYRVNHKRSISANVPSGPLYYRLIYDAKENEPGGIPYAIKQTFKIGPDHFEPNNQASQAYQLPLKDQTITGSFHTDGDQDWYQLTLDKGGLIRLQVTEDTARIDPVLMIYDGDNRMLARVDEAGGGHPEVWKDWLPAGVYRIRLINYTPVAVDGYYRLNTQWTPGGIKGSGSNDHISRAKTLPFDTNVYGKLNQGGANWFQFNVAKTSRLALTLSDLPSNGETRVALYANNRLIGQKGSQGAYAFVLVERLTPGAYQLKLSTSARYPPLYMYRLKARLDQLIAGYADIAGHWGKDAIVRLTNQGILSGYEDYTFRPDRALTRAEAIAMLVRVTGVKATGSTPFADISGHWASDAIARAYHAGWINGVSDNRFDPDSPITRGEMAKILTAVKDVPLLSSRRPSFKDVSKNYWYYAAVETARQKGWLVGYRDGRFYPQRALTRAELASIIDRVW